MKLTGAVIPDEIVRRVIARRGSEHCFAELDPARTALVVIDLQHAFMNEAVGFAPLPAAHDILPAVNRLAPAAGATGGGAFSATMTPVTPPFPPRAPPPTLPPPPPPRTPP